MRPTVMEVDTNQFCENIRYIQDYIGNKKIMPVIKANAYGTYIHQNIDILNQFDIVAVAVVREAIFLRKLGYQKEIFLLNQPYVDELDDILLYDITVGVCEMSFLDHIENHCKVKVHLEIESGMNRTGISFKELESFLKNIPRCVDVEGVYTHFSSADYDKEYTLGQINIFQDAVMLVKRYFPNVSYIHSSASNGLLQFDDGVSNFVRPGILMYGYESFPGTRRMIPVRPICRLKTKVTFLKHLSKGEAVSYSKSFVASHDMVVATIPIGYADGLRRELSNQGFVVIGGVLAPIIGNICMDSCLVDVTQIPSVMVGSDVYLWDNDIFTVEEIATMCHTINYEILCTISSRVPRVFL